MGVMIEEQETTISYGRTDKDACVWTSDSTMMTKLDRLCEIAPDMYKCVDVGQKDGEILSKEYLIADKRMVSFRSVKAKRNLTQEQKEQAAARLKAYNESKRH